MPIDPIELARSFAQALDREDYEAARSMLDDTCVYLIRGERHVGPDAILASYKGNGDSAARTFDRIRYESDVRRDADGACVIAFVDRIEHAGRALVHRCEQRLTVNGSGLITTIEHHDLPGERERLERFRVEAGLS